jgi:tetratricopeptide (TPR) repeat protein
VEGRRYELDEVHQLANQRVQFVFERNRITLRPGVAATERGEQLGSAGRYDEALEAFRTAAQADPFGPHARYQEGLTLLHLRRYAEAVEAYEATEELAPGWFHCRADLWLAQQLALGDLGQETFLALHVLEDGELPPQEKANLAAQALSRAPRLALLHLLHGKSLTQFGRSDEAQAAYRRGLACEPEPDTKTRLLVELGVLVTGPAERVRLLQEAQALGGNLVAAATATLALRASAPAGS